MVDDEESLERVFRVMEDEGKGNKGILALTRRDGRTSANTDKRCTSANPDG